MAFVKIKLVRVRRTEEFYQHRRREIGQGDRSTNQSGQEINDGLEMTEIPASFFKARFAHVSLSLDLEKDGEGAVKTAEKPPTRCYLLCELFF